MKLGVQISRPFNEALNKNGCKLANPPTNSQHEFKGIYILLGLPMKEWNWGGTKLSKGQLSTFQDRQDSCLPSAARLDSPGDQGKGKVGPKKVLFFQEYDFFQG